MVLYLDAASVEGEPSSTKVGSPRAAAEVGLPRGGAEVRSPRAASPAGLFFCQRKYSMDILSGCKPIDTLDLS